MFRDTNYFLATPDEVLLNVFRKLGTKVPEVANFLSRSRTVTCFGVSCEQDDLVDSIEAGFHTLSGFVDGISLALDGTRVDVSHVVLVRENGSMDLDAHIFLSEGGWATIAGSPDFQTSWEKRRDVIYARVLKFADLVNGVGQSEIADQIQCSTKMFRHGGESRVFGMQFLAKFSAVEGLVCGPERHNHGNLLRTRIPALFPTIPAASSQIADLWNYRCSASHQARAFERFGGDALPAHIPTLDFFFIGLFVFAIDHCESVSTFDELWREAPSYSLPPEILLERPPNAGRFAVRRGHSPTQWRLNGQGRIFDQFFKR